MFAKKSVFGDAEADPEEIHVNLTPMIDVLTCLLFFLLLSFGAVIIALINSSVPTIAEGDAPEANLTKTSVTLGLHVAKNNILATVSNDALSETELNKWKRTFRPQKEGYDWKKINEYCYALKRQFQKSTNVIITPEPTIEYDLIIKVMDATREKDVVINRRPLKLPLFPEAIISTIVD